MEYKKREEKGQAKRRIFVVPSQLMADIRKQPLAKSLAFSDIGCFERDKYHHCTRQEACEQMILIYCYEGSGYCISNGKKVNIETDSLLFIPEHTAHTYASSSNNPWSILWVHLYGDNIKKFFEYEENEISVFLVPSEKKLRMKFLFEEIFELLERGFQTENLIYSYQIMNHILGLLFYCTTFNRMHIKEKEYSIDQSVQFMLESLEKNLTLNDLALHSKLSASHYSFLFKKHTGVAPMNYFIGLKIQKACSYLDVSEYRIGEISELLGFKDAFYFSRIFHKIMGMSPSEYRKRQKG